MLYQLRSALRKQSRSTSRRQLVEQQRIVAKLAQLLGHCDALEQRIQTSRQLAGQLLQTALREALAGPGAAAVLSVPEPAAPGRSRAATAGQLPLFN